MNQKLEAIRRKCIEANPQKVWVETNCQIFGEARVLHGNEPRRAAIRLADVLNAIRQSDKYVNVNKFGNFVAYDDAGLGATWNLFHDDLEQQSPETIDFISSVLGV